MKPISTLALAQGCFGDFITIPYRVLPGGILKSSVESLDKGAHMHFQNLPFTLEPKP